MVSEISSHFVTLSGDDFDQGVRYALKKTGEILEADCVYLCSFSGNGKFFSETHFWSASKDAIAGLKDREAYLNAIPWWYDKIMAGDYVYIPDFSDSFSVAELGNVFSKPLPQSLLCVPVIKEKEVVSFLGLESQKEKRIWTDEHIVLLKIITELMTNAFIRNEYDEKIRYLSFHDRLTGLYNRHFLEEEMKRLDDEKHFPVSMVMADLNGLKLVNDTYGHQKGDEMLRIVAGILQDCCNKDYIIGRWGGDEFIIILPNTPESEAMQISNNLATSCRNRFLEDVPVSIAFGVATKSDQDKSFADTMSEAEDYMYKRKLTESRSTKSAVLQTLLKTLAEKSYETEEHTRRMKVIGEKIGMKLNLPDSELSRLELLITLHDIGKINIAEEILMKKGPLTEDEWITIRKHPETGFRIARATEEFAHVAEDILSHHERWDGAGYPRALKGKEISLLARIVAVADAYEVMSNGRPYKQRMNADEILNEFRACSGKHFDPEIVAVFIAIISPE